MNYIIINSFGCTNLAERSLLGCSSLTRVLNFAKNLEKTAGFSQLSKFSIKIWQNNMKFVHVNEKQALQLLFSQLTTTDKNSQLIIIRADAPLLNRSLTEQIIQKHLQFHADFTYPEAYPQGLLPTVVQFTSLLKLSNMISGEQPFSSIEDIFKRHLKDFHIESLVAPFFWRYQRFSLLARKRTDFYLLETLIKKGATAENNPLSIIKNQPQILRTLPASLQIQLKSVEQLGCIYQPPPQPFQALMSKDIWQKITLQLQDLNPEAVLYILPFGATTQHPEFFEFLQWVFKHTSLKVVLETQAQGISQTMLEQLCSLKRLHWIILLDSLDPQVYREIHAAELQPVLQVIQRLQKEDINCHIQAVRMRLNETALADFQNYWKERNLPCIIQKYNDFGDLITQRAVVDLQPWKRIPCFRLQRELAFDTYGRAFLCLQDLYHQEYPLGQITRELMKDIWAQGAKFYQKHCQKNYPELCNKCDEYYSWNF